MMNGGGESVAGGSRYGHMGRLGWEELKAFWRQGLAEARAAIFPDSNIVQPVDPAMWGVLSQGEAADKRSLDAAPTSPVDRVKHSEPNLQPTTPRREVELEMG